MPAALDARVAPLRRLTDHEPTFPPASLPPADGAHGSLDVVAAIGSCSFPEPVEQLRRLGMLP